MQRAKVKFTYEDYLQLPEDKRYELIEGDFFMVPSPSPFHQDISRNLFQILEAYVRGKSLGKIYYAPLDVVLSEEDVLQPDIFFISRERFGIITESNIQGAPDLIIEILSPASAERDRTLKRKLYARFGVQEYWLVDLDKKAIEVMAPTEAGLERIGIYRKGEFLRSPLLTGLSIDLKDIFE